MPTPICQPLDPSMAYRHGAEDLVHALASDERVATAIPAGLWVYERDAALPYEALDIFAVVLLNATMGCVQDREADTTAPKQVAKFPS